MPPQFRKDNTAGFGPAERAEMNLEFETAMAEIDRDAPDYDEIVKATAERILRRHGAA